MTDLSRLCSSGKVSHPGSIPIVERQLAAPEIRLVCQPVRWLSPSRNAALSDLLPTSHPTATRWHSLAPQAFPSDFPRTQTHETHPPGNNLFLNPPSTQFNCFVSHCFAYPIAHRSLLQFSGSFKSLITLPNSVARLFQAQKIG